VVPGWEEVGRLVVYLVVSVAYVSFWLGLGYLVLHPVPLAGHLGASRGDVVDLFFILHRFAADLAADALAPVKNARDPEEIVANRRVADATSLASPAVLYSQATSTILDPYRRSRSNLVLTGPDGAVVAGTVPEPLPLDQSILVVWPYLTLLAALTLVCFACPTSSSCARRSAQCRQLWFQGQRRHPSKTGHATFGAQSVASRYHPLADGWLPDPGPTFSRKLERRHSDISKTGESPHRRCRLPTGIPAHRQERTATAKLISARR